MTLAGRVSLALVSTLAVALAAAGAGVYLIVRSVLTQRIDQRLDGALDALGALIELEPGGLEWDTENRSVTIGGESHDDEVRWLALDGEGGHVADSGNLGALPVESVSDLAGCAPGAGEGRKLDTVESGERAGDACACDALRLPPAISRP